MNKIIRQINSFGVTTSTKREAAIKTTLADLKKTMNEVGIELKPFNMYFSDAQENGVVSNWKDTEVTEWGLMRAGKFVSKKSLSGAQLNWLVQRDQALNPNAWNPNYEPEDTKEVFSGKHGNDALVADVTESLGSYQMGGLGEGFGSRALVNPAELGEFNLRAWQIEQGLQYDASPVAYVVMDKGVEKIDFLDPIVAAQVKETYGMEDWDPSTKKWGGLSRREVVGQAPEWLAGKRDSQAILAEKLESLSGAFRAKFASIGDMCRAIVAGEYMEWSMLTAESSEVEWVMEARPIIADSVLMGLLPMYDGISEMPSVRHFLDVGYSARGKEVKPDMGMWSIPAGFSSEGKWTSRASMEKMAEKWLDGERFIETAIEAMESRYQPKSCKDNGVPMWDQEAGNVGVDGNPTGDYVLVDEEVLDDLIINVESLKDDACNASLEEWAPFYKNLDDESSFWDGNTYYAEGRKYSGAAKAKKLVEQYRERVWGLKKAIKPLIQKGRSAADWREQKQAWNKVADLVTEFFASFTTNVQAKLGKELLWVKNPSSELLDEQDPKSRVTRVQGVFLVRGDKRFEVIKVGDKIQLKATRDAGELKSLRVSGTSVSQETLAQVMLWDFYARGMGAVMARSIIACRRAKKGGDVWLVKDQVGLRGAWPNVPRWAANWFLIEEEVVNDNLASKYEDPNWESWDNSEEVE